MAQQYFGTRASFARFLLGIVVACTLVVAVRTGVSSATVRLTPGAGSDVWNCSKGDLSCPPSAQTLAPMPTARYRLTAATGSDGRIYTFGGSGAVSPPGPALDTLEAYDLTSNSWTCSTNDSSPGCMANTLAPMPTARERAGAVTASDGRIYVLGGDDGLGAGSGSNVLSIVEAYDPITNSWICSANDNSCSAAQRTLTPMPSARNRFAVVAGPDGRIYAIGGYEPSNFLATSEVYDLHSNTWDVTLPPMTTPRGEIAAAVGTDHRIYAIGGWVGGSSFLNSVEAYDVTAKTWTPVLPLAQARGGLVAAIGRDGRIYAIGGWGSETGRAISAFNTVEAYSASSGAWERAAAMPSARSRGAAAVGRDQRIYVFGGAVNNSVLNQVEGLLPPTHLFLPQVFR